MAELAAGSGGAAEEYPDEGSQSEDGDHWGDWGEENHPDLDDHPDSNGNDY
jgi:hypothetical protein